MDSWLASSSSSSALRCVLLGDWQHVTNEWMAKRVVQVSAVDSYRTGSAAAAAAAAYSCASGCDDEDDEDEADTAAGSVH